MAFVRRTGKTKVMWYPVAASSGAMAAGSLVALSGGNIVLATNTVDSFYIVGVLEKAIATTDVDYAVARLVPVEVPVEANVEWVADVTTGTLVASSVGLYFDLSTDDLGEGVDQSASNLDIAFCTKYLSATKGVFILNIGPLAHVKA